MESSEQRTFRQPGKSPLAFYRPHLSSTHMYVATLFLTTFLDGRPSFLYCHPPFCLRLILLITRTNIMEFLLHHFTLDFLPSFLPWLPFLSSIPPSFLHFTSYLGVDGLAMLMGWRSLWKPMLYQSHYMPGLFGEGWRGLLSLTSIISFLHFLPTLTSMTSFTVALEFLALLIHLTPFLDVIDFLPRLPCWNPIFPSYLEILPLRFILT